MGSSILLSKGDEKWLNHRKSLGQAFYKDKLIRYVDLTRESINLSVDSIKKQYVDPEREMDLI